MTGVVLVFVLLLICAAVVLVSQIMQWRNLCAIRKNLEKTFGGKSFDEVYQFVHKRENDEFATKLVGTLYHTTKPKTTQSNKKGEQYGKDLYV